MTAAALTSHRGRRVTPLARLARRARLCPRGFTRTGRTDPGWASGTAPRKIARCAPRWGPAGPAGPAFRPREPPGSIPAEASRRSAVRASPGATRAGPRATTTTLCAARTRSRRVARARNRPNLSPKAERRRPRRPRRRRFPGRSTRGGDRRRRRRDVGVVDGVAARDAGDEPPAEGDDGASGARRVRIGVRDARVASCLLQARRRGENGRAGGFARRARATRGARGAFFGNVSEKSRRRGPRPRGRRNGFRFRANRLVVRERTKRRRGARGRPLRWRSARGRRRRCSGRDAEGRRRAGHDARAAAASAAAASLRAARRRRRGAREEARQTARAAEPGTGTRDDARDRRVHRADSRRSCMMRRRSKAYRVAGKE